MTQHQSPASRPPHLASLPCAAPLLPPAPPELSFYSHMLAGAAAGTTEHLAMFPLDTVKTRMQAVPHGGASISHALNYGSLRSAVGTILRREGVGGLYRGVGAAALGAGPAHALYFATYEAAKRLGGGEGAGPGATAAAGAAATLVADAVATPLDTLKARLQIANSPYRSLGECARATLAAEGVPALFRAYGTTVAMNVPFTAVQLVVYEAAKAELVARSVLGEGEEGLREQLLAGGAAGGAAAAVTNPLDVAKTRLQTAGVWEPAPAAEGGGAAAASSAPHAGGAAKPPGVARAWGRLIPLLADIARREGVGALASGIGPRVLFHVPAAAVCWGTYETGKRALLAL